MQEGGRRGRLKDSCSNAIHGWHLWKNAGDAEVPKRGPLALKSVSPIQGLLPFHSALVKGHTNGSTGLFHPRNGRPQSPYTAMSWLVVRTVLPCTAAEVAQGRLRSFDLELFDTRERRTTEKASRAHRKYIRDGQSDLQSAQALWIAVS